MSANSLIHKVLDELASKNFSSEIQIPSSQILVLKVPLSRKFVEVLLGRKIKEITAPELQKTKKPLRVSKGVRFDVYFEGEAELINIECQVGNYGDIAKRARYYKSILNVDSLDKGEKYDPDFRS